MRRTGRRRSEEDASLPLTPMSDRPSSRSRTSFESLELTRIWDKALRLPPWGGSPVWVHADLHTDNLLADRDQIVAVLDFGMLGTGIRPMTSGRPGSCSMPRVGSSSDGRSSPIGRRGSRRGDGPPLGDSLPTPTIVIRPTVCLPPCRSGRSGRCSPKAEEGAILDPWTSNPVAESTRLEVRFLHGLGPSR